MRGRVQQGVDVAEQGGDGRLEAWNPKPVMFQATRYVADILAIQDSHASPLLALFSCAMARHEGSNKILGRPLLDSCRAFAFCTPLLNARFPLIISSIFGCLHNCSEVDDFSPCLMLTSLEPTISVGLWGTWQLRIEIWCLKKKKKKSESKHHSVIEGRRPRWIDHPHQRSSLSQHHGRFIPEGHPASRPNCR